jgi:hypothetical protein
MDVLIKKASAYTTEEKASLGISGIPNDWPVEKMEVVDPIPDGFELISEEDLLLLKENNQAAYDAWLNGLRPIVNLPPPAPLAVSVSNSISVAATPSFGAKTLVINGVTKKFFARNTGAQYDLVSGSNDISFTIGYPWVKVTGVECFGSETLDTCELRVYDSPAGTYSGVSGAFLNQFGYSLNLAKDYYHREAPYDADLYYGMVLKMNYVSRSDKKIGINFLMTEVKT